MNASSASQAPFLSSILAPALGSWKTIFSHQISTQQHVPKGAGDVWAELIHDALNSFNRNLTSVEPWLKLFLLPRCVSANPYNGGRLHWCMILKTIKTHACMKRWQAHEVFFYFWSDFLSSVKNGHGRHADKKKASQQDSVGAANIKQAKLAVEACQCRKGIQALTSQGQPLPLLKSWLKYWPNIHRSKPPSLPSPILPHHLPTLWKMWWLRHHVLSPGTLLQVHIF